MSENEDVIISKNDIDNVTREVLERDKVEQEKLRKEIEEKVRKEIVEEQEKQKLVEDKKKLEAALVQKEKEAVEERDRLRKEMEEIRASIGQSKAQVNDNNPFIQGKTKEEGLNLDDLTPEQINEIEENSKAEFKKSLVGRGGIGADFTRW